MELRYYQRESVDAVFRYFSRNGMPANASPAIKLPTGSGKSLVIAAITRQLIEQYKCRVLMATHRAELIEQNKGDLLRYWPEASVGIYSAGLNSRDTKQSIIFCGIQSAVNRFSEFGHRDVMLIDEAHLVSTEDGTNYHKFINGLRIRNPDMRLIGLSATPYRLGQGLITQGEGALFSSIVYSVNERDLIEQGYLCPLVSRSSNVVDTAMLKISGHEFNIAASDLAFNTDQVKDTVVRDIVNEFKCGRKKALVYGTSVEHAQNLADAIQNTGLIAAVVTGDTPRNERKNIYEAFSDGAIHCLCSCDVLTTGFNVPAVDLIALVRATMSTALYVQILGRGMRIHPAKSDCLILDYGENIARHGPIDEIKIKPKGTKGEGGKAPFKICNKCGAENHAMARMCIHCDSELPAPEKKLAGKASELQPLSVAPKLRHTIAQPDQRWKCEKMTWRKHRKTGSNTTTVRVDYYSEKECFNLLASEWLCPEHEGFARRRFETWWRTNVKTPIPNSVEETMTRLNEMNPIVEICLKEKEDSNFKEVTRIITRKRGMGEDEIENEPDHNDSFFDSDLPF